MPLQFICTFLRLIEAITDLFLVLPVLQYRVLPINQMVGFVL